LIRYLFFIPIIIAVIYIIYQENNELCRGSAACFSAKVERIIDGDTIEVNGKRIRLALVDTPERNELLYAEAKAFTARLCPVGSEVLIDQDDKQRYDRYGRMIAKVYCSDKILNAELLSNKLAVIDKRFCSKSEFADEPWTDC
jgi:micrococcal nuclease